MAPTKKHHKKHKKHKHLKTAKQEFESDEIVDVINLPTTPVRFESSSAHDKLGKLLKNTPPSAKSSKNKKNKMKDVESDSEEERWLDAIESGKLEEVDDELKKIKNPKLMTARQRAMYERGNSLEDSNSELLMSLPLYKEKVMTPELIQKIQLKNQRRKQLADKKREEDKKKTMERLLKKQETKQRNQGRNRIAKIITPMIIYKSTTEGSVVIMPPEFDYPLKARNILDVKIPQIILCAVCEKNPKRYNCSKSNVPLCSFQCYKKNSNSNIFDEKNKTSITK